MGKLLVMEKQSCYLLSDYPSIRYFTGVDLAEGFVAVTQNARLCFTDARYFYGVKDALIKNGVTPILYTGIESIKIKLDDLNIKTLYLDYDKSTVREYVKFLSLGYDVKDGTETVKKIRAIKTDREIDAVKRACNITQTAFYRLLEEVKEGVTELELKEKLLTLYRELGAQGESFDTIVAFGKNSAVPHHQTGGTVLEKGMPILIDTGCLIDGYASDFTRTVYFGKPTEEFISAYNAVKQANEYAIENIKDGTYTDQADGYARAVLKEYGLEEYFTHSLGHGLGLEIHEYPTLSIKCKDRLENKMLFTIEPGVYFDGKFGIRIEDTVLLDGKAERLYTDKKDLIIL